MKAEQLGKRYPEGAVIIRQGEVGDCMYVVQEGQVEVVKEMGGKEVRLAVLAEGEPFGEMALFEREVRSATVRVLNEARVLTVEKRTFLRRVHEDPSLAYRIIQQMSQRIRKMSADLAQLKVHQTKKGGENGNRRLRDRRATDRRASSRRHEGPEKREETQRRSCQQRRAGRERRSDRERRGSYSWAPP